MTARDGGRWSQTLRRRGFALALPLLLTAAQAAPDTLTLAEARALPTEALARRVLGASGALIDTAHVDAGIGMFANPYRLSSITLAGAPRSAGFPGLCLADTYVAIFRPAGSEQGQDREADLPSRVASLEHEVRFRRVDAGPPPAQGWNDTYGKAMDTACAGTSPVLRPDGTSTFFHNRFDSGVDARGVTASIALAVLAAAATPGPAVTVTCQTLLPGACRRQAIELAKRAPDDVQSAPCEKSPARRCVQAQFDLGWLHWLTLTVESDAGPRSVVYGEPPLPIRAIRVEEVQAIE